MRKIIFILLACIMALPVSCEKVNMDGLEVQDLTMCYPESIILTKSQNEITGGINDFSYDIYRQVYENKDIFISPFSIALALSMLTTGADGDTEEQLLSALGFEGKTTEDLDAYYSTVMSNMKSSDPSTTLCIANAIWASKNITLKSQYVDDCNKYFDSTAESVDFSDPATLKTINEWTRNNTNGKIEKLFDELAPSTAAVLANALYFKASWPFEFTRSGKRMFAKIKTSYFEGDGFSGVRIPYGNGTFAMRITLPSKNKSLKDVVAGLDGQSFLYTNVSYETAIVSLDMPVFSFSYGNKLNAALQALGIKDAYDPNKADFSKMAYEPLYVSDVSHKTFVDVNEKGTEAAAVTAVTMEFASAGPIAEPREIEFKVDRDFIFEIIDQSCGLTVFVGQHLL